MILIILYITIPFIFSHIMSIYKPFLKDKRDYDQAFYFFKNNKYIRDYTGICFNGLKESWLLFRFQTGITYDRSITICNISFIFPRKR